MQNTIFSFNDMAADSRVAASVSHRFSQAGARVVQAEVDPKMRRTAGVSYRTVTLTFADGQRATLYVTSSNEIYQVDLNGKVIPLRDGADHVRAIDEVVRMMDSGRVRYQATLAKTRVALPTGIRTAAPRMEEALRQKIADLDAAIAATHEEIARYA